VRYACSPSGCVTACVVYTADSIRDSIRTKKNDSQVPIVNSIIVTVIISSRSIVVIYVTASCVKCPLWVKQPGQLSLPSPGIDKISNNLCNYMYYGGGDH